MWSALVHRNRPSRPSHWSYSESILWSFFLFLIFNWLTFLSLFSLSVCSCSGESSLLFSFHSYGRRTKHVLFHFHSNKSIESIGKLSLRTSWWKSYHSIGVVTSWTIKLSFMESIDSNSVEHEEQNWICSSNTSLSSQRSLYLPCLVQM